MKRREPGAEDDTEEEQHGDDSLGLLGIFGDESARARRLIRVGGEVGGIQGCDDHEEYDDYAQADYELRPPPPFVCVDGAEDGAAKGDDVLGAVVCELFLSAVDAGSFEHLGIVVADGTIATPLNQL